MLYMNSLYELLISVVFIVIITALYYWYLTRNFDYWSKRNIPFVKPIPFLGSAAEYFFRPIHEVDDERYKKYGRLYGIYEGDRPYLVVADPAILRDIMVKDFHIFPNRRIMSSGDAVTSKGVHQMTGEDWKRIRTIISPTFSTAKIKKLINLFKEASETAIQNFKKEGQNGKPLEVKNIIGSFTLDAIANSAFSLKIDSYNDTTNEFVTIANSTFRPKFNWRPLTFFLFPNIVKLLRIYFWPAKGVNFFRNLSLSIIAERKKTGERRNDYLQLLLDTSKELSEDGKSEIKETETQDMATAYGGVSTNHKVFKNVNKKELTVNEITAQCMFFFFAGFETVGTVLTYLMYNLALNEEIQEKLHEELVDALKETNGELTYEVLQNLKYLANVISETLRLYPPGVRLDRTAASDYKLGNTGITIPKGSVIIIPVYSIHRDAEFFPNPEKFDPDRFNETETSKRDHYVYLPFGAGPRNCIAMRFALIEMRVFAAYIIANFKIHKSPKTRVPLEFLKAYPRLVAKEIYLSLGARNDSPIVK